MSRSTIIRVSGLFAAGFACVALAAGGAAVVSPAKAQETVYNFNQPKQPAKKVRRRARKKKADGSGLYLSPACAVPGVGSIVCLLVRPDNENHF